MFWRMAPLFLAAGLNEECCFSFAIYHISMQGQGRDRHGAGGSSSGCQPEGARGWFRSHLRGIVGEEKKMAGQVAGSTDIRRADGEEKTCAEVEKEAVRKWKGCRQVHRQSRMGFKEMGEFSLSNWGKKLILHSVVEDMGKQTRGCNLI